MTNLIDFNDVRNTSGATVVLIPDDTITDIITKSQAQALSSWKIFIEPTKVLEIRDGNGKNKIHVRNPYIWKLLEFQTRIGQGQSHTFDLEAITIKPISGMITINRFERFSHLLFRYPNSVRMKYLSAFMGKTITITETTADIAVGTLIDIPVDSETGFTVDDWVLIEGLDGKREAAQITATAANQITVDELVQSHLTESVITLLETEESLVQYILYDVCTNVASYIVGNTSKLATSYTQEGVTATIGVAWTHWTQSRDAFAKKRNEFKAKINNKLNAVS